MHDGASLERDVRSLFRALLADGSLRVVTTHYEPAVFGNAFVIIGGDGVRLRFIWDRGDIYGDFSRESEPERWFPLGDAIAAVNHGDIPKLQGLDGHAAAVLDAWPKLVQAISLGWEELERELTRIGAAATKAFLERARKPKGSR